MLTSITLSLAIAVTCFMAYGVTGATLIFVLEFQLVALCAGMWGVIKSDKEKTAIAIMVVFYGFMLLQQIPYMMDLPLIGPSFGMFIVVIGTFLFVMALSSVISHSSDLWRCSGGLNNDNLHIVLKRPKTMLDYVVSILGSPVSSVSFASGNKWYKYDANSGLCLPCDNREGYVFVDTGIKQDIDIMENKPWSWRHNCVAGYYPITSGTYLEPKPWEWLPSVYVKRILKERKKHV